MKNKTQHTNKIGIKKKIDLMDPKQNKLRAVTEKKPPLKSELLVQFKALQKDYDTLKHEHEKNLGTIKNLEEKVSLLMRPSTCLRSKGSQMIVILIKNFTVTFVAGGLMQKVI